MQKWFRRVKYITLVNLLATDEIFSDRPTPYDPSQEGAPGVLFPEYLTWQDKSEQIARHVVGWLKQPAEREALVEALSALRAEVAGEGASSRAAEYIVGRLTVPAAPIPRPHFATGAPSPSFSRFFPPSKVGLFPPGLTKKKVRSIWGVYQREPREERAMTLQDILTAKGNAVFTISPHATLQEAAGVLLKYRVGALLVFETEGERAIERMLGILSERDLLWSCATSPGTLDQVKVSTVMSSPVITGTPEDRIEHVMGLMTRERKRHLPVAAGGRLLGMISIGDLVKWQHDQMALENRFMKDYISR